ncbi:hypothetical protein CEXT_448851 [Caerostris extrusa]|uniref:Uncharacterized protein n=1 Tax=Caerostris extrusa TaxID=172846 RepID=A0AAV4PMR1_CAEEX|nr:hypothetical protein CEXT_448851 [Caerostris extrusa]
MSSSSCAHSLSYVFLLMCPSSIVCLYPHGFILCNPYRCVYQIKTLPNVSMFTIPQCPLREGDVTFVDTGPICPVEPLPSYLVVPGFSPSTEMI